MREDKRPQYPNPLFENHDYPGLEMMGPGDYAESFYDTTKLDEDESYECIAHGQSVPVNHDGDDGSRYIAPAMAHQPPSSSDIYYDDVGPPKAATVGQPPKPHRYSNSYEIMYN